jgi:alkylation response protein AidB-like acyl-CoA dehydrogenase
MSQYQFPRRELSFLLEHVFPLSEHARRCSDDLDLDTAMAVLEEAGKFAREVIDPLNRIGDRTGSTWHEDGVMTPAGFREAYQSFCAAGWNGLRFPEQYRGQGLSAVLASLVDEMWHAASFSFALCPMLTNGAVEALLTAGDACLKSRYVPKLVSGEWTGTMNLTEPSAGSDLAAVRTKAVRADDGTYRITGQKIFITFGDHDLTDNIVHLVLARTPDAPPGVKGISLFVVPKFMLNEDGSLGERNDVRCGSIEHKLGIHGSPTAVMLFGERDGAVGYLVGEENRGIEYMFVMMNDARYSVGLQGLAISERAYQHALAYAFERIQGRPLGDKGEQASPIIGHPDIRRLLLSMKSRIDAMRGLAVYVAMQKDLVHSIELDSHTREQSQGVRELLVPVLKGWLTETAQEITSDALQVFGGMGYVEETGAAQYFRDARITTIYEGTTAIQANDLLGRKTIRDGGAVAYGLIEMVETEARTLMNADSSAARLLGTRLGESCAALRGVVNWIVRSQKDAVRQVYSGAVPYLKLWGIVAGGWVHGRRVGASLSASVDAGQRLATAASARFFAEHYVAQGPTLALQIVSGGTGALEYPDTEW